MGQLADRSEDILLSHREHYEQNARNNLYSTYYQKH